MPARKILAGGAFTDKIRAYWTVNLATCWIRHRAAKCFRLSSRPGGSPLNSRMSNEELDKNVQGFMNIREAVGSYFEIAVHCHWEYDFTTRSVWRKRWRSSAPGG
jgi:hypothetical protein